MSTDTAPLEYSKDIDAEIVEAVEDKLKVEVTGSQRIEMGEVSFVYKLETKEKGNLVDKVFKLNEFVPPEGKLEWIEEQLALHDIPCARTLLIDRESKGFSTGIMVQEFIEGRNGFDAIMQGDIPFQEFFDQLVVILQRVHSITPEQFRDFPDWSDNPKSISDTRLEYYNKVREQLDPLGDIDGSIHQTVLAEVQKLNNYDYLYKPCLIHGDPGGQNTIIRENGELVLIDWDNAKIGSWIEEYAGMTFRGAFMHQYKTDEQRNEMIEKSFRNKYTGVDFDDPDLRALVKILHILNAYGVLATHYFQHQDKELYEVAKKRLMKMLNELQ